MVGKLWPFKLSIIFLEIATPTTLSSWKITLTHGKLMDGHSDALKVDRSSRNVLRTCGKLTEGPADIRKAGRRSHDCTESWSRNRTKSWRKFMKGSVDLVNVEGLSCRSRESSLKFTKDPAFTQEVLGRFLGHTKMSWKLKECPADAQI